MTFVNGSALDPSWISFNPSTRVLTATPPPTVNALEQVKIYASDIYNTPTVATLNITTDFKPKVNPAVTVLSGKLICLQSSTFTISPVLFTDEDATLTYTLTYPNGTAIPTWLTFTAPATSASGNFEFSGTYPTFTSLSIDFTLTARDSKSQTKSVTITAIITPVCNSLCKTCTGPNIDDCLSCYSDRYLYISLCKVNCPDGYYNDASTNTCKSCDQSCKTCNGALNSNCIACTNNATDIYYKFNGICYQNCPSGYANIDYDQSCAKCHSYCTECYGTKSTECTACDINNRYTLISPDTCVYLECPSLTYYDQANFKCQDCNKMCKNCFAGTASSCIDCPYSTFISSDHSCKTCAQINSGLKFEPLMNTCLETCGKGYNLGFLECDDGNTVNGDGCSSSCKVEINWMCSGGNSTSKDICKYKIGPKCEFSTISSSSYLGTIALSENVTFNKYTEGDIIITISGPLSPYKFTYKIDNTTGFVDGQTGMKFRIQFNFQSSLAGSNKETITVKFNNKKIVSDIYGNYLETDVVTKQIPFFLSVVSDAEKAQASQGSTMSLVSLILTFGTSIFISVVLGGTIEATWLLLGTLQMMSLVPLFNLNLPGNFREFSVNLAVLNGEPQAFPNIFENFIDTSNLKPFNPYFELMNFKTTLLLMNAGRKVMIWIAMIASMGVSFIIYDLFSELGKW